MADPPETRYAKTGDSHIAYQAVGDGNIDLVLVQQWASALDATWDEPGTARFLRRLTRFGRLILFDRRGMGLSDPVAPDHLPTLEQSVDDLLAVLDSTESNQVVLIGLADGGPSALMLATADRGRVRAMVLVNSYARILRSPDYPFGLPSEIQEPFVTTLGEMWGSGATIDMLAPSVRTDDVFRTWWARMERASASPGTAMRMFNQLFETDIRPLLPLVAVPTLVIHQRDDQLIRVDHGRYLADAIPAARYVELPGEDHFVTSTWLDVLVDEIQEFVTGVRPIPEPDRVLAAILFTDVVGSTEQVAALGDRRWRQLLENHDSVTRRVVDAHRGRLVKLTGDGALVTFDGPGQAIRCAFALRDALDPLGVQIRGGLHTGELELRGEDIGGLAVHIAARVVEHAGPGDLMVSAAVPLLVAGSGIEFEDRGEHVLKGVPGVWRLYATTGFGRAAGT